MLTENITFNSGNGEDNQSNSRQIEDRETHHEGLDLLEETANSGNCTGVDTSPGCFT